MKIEILGAGCAKCKSAHALIAKTLAETGAEAELIKVEDMAEIMQAGIMTTPGIRVDGKMKLIGKVPSHAQVAAWLAAGK
ncbi:MAG TPA: thioredoxin family protein [Rhodobacterales bacterium]|nr:thioredoxin family protein [Rhodobacterales bacterium]